MINKPTVITVLGVLLLLSYSLFLKGFFPLKQGLEGFSSKNDAPDVPGMKTNPFPNGKHTRLILLVIDALRADFVFEGKYQMPFLWKLIADKEGLGFLAKAHPPTVTLPRIKALTTGGIPGFVDVVLNFGSSSLDEDNIVTQLHGSGKELVFYGDDTWMKLFPGHFLRTDGTTSFFVTDYTEVDTNVSRHLPDELTRFDWDVLILHYLGLDHIGHLAGPRSPLVSPKLMEMDGVIHKIYQAMKHWYGESGLHSVMMVCGDHGMSDQGGHGGASPGETTVPVIFMSPSFKDSTVHAVNTKENIMQIDVAPTLATLLGIPIPKNNLGEIVTDTLIGYSLEEKVRLIQINGYQVANVLKHNVADVDKEKGYRLYEQTVSRHSDWLKARNTSQEPWEVLGQRLMKDYGRAIQEMRSRVSETSTNYDLHMMGVSITLLWLILFFLLSVSMAFTPTFHLSANRITVSLICSIPVVLGHMTICTSQIRSPFLCSNNVLVVLVLLIVMVVVVTATLFSVMIVVRWRRNKKQSVFYNYIDKVFVGGCILHTFSLLSSSFVEEEHQTWYFFITTLHIILICRLIGHICPVSKTAADRGDQSRYRLRYGSHEEHTDSVNMYQQRLSGDRSSGERSQKSVGGLEVTRSVAIQSVTAIFAVLILCRVLRRWNQTGDKWLTVPDVGDWLVSPDHKLFLSVTVAVSMLCLTVTRWRSTLPFQSSLTVIAMTTTYCYRAANGVVALPGIYTGTSKGLQEARITYCFLVIFLISILWRWWGRPDKANSSLTELWQSLQSAWLMLTMLLLRPHNSALVAMAALTESLVSNHIISVMKLRPTFLTLYCVWMGQAFSFFQGNSNSLTTVDVSAGYVGLDDYRPVLIGLLMFCSTYAGPIFWMISLIKYLHMPNMEGDSTSLLKLTGDHVTSAVTLLTSRALPLAVYTLLVSVERYHLFVWTVFSPKLLYEGNLSVVICVFAIIHVACALQFGKMARGMKKYDK